MFFMKIGYGQAINSAAHALYGANEEIENVEKVLLLGVTMIPNLTLLISLAQFVRKPAKEWVCSYELGT